jgi:hypothetical protein
MLMLTSLSPAWYRAHLTSKFEPWGARCFLPASRTTRARACAPFDVNPAFEHVYSPEVLVPSESVRRAIPYPDPLETPPSSLHSLLLVGLLRGSLLALGGFEKERNWAHQCATAHGLLLFPSLAQENHTRPLQCPLSLSDGLFAGGAPSKHCSSAMLSLCARRASSFPLIHRFFLVASKQARLEL